MGYEEQEALNDECLILHYCTFNNLTLISYLESSNCIYKTHRRKNSN